MFGIAQSRKLAWTHCVTRVFLLGLFSGACVPLANQDDTAPNTIVRPANLFTPPSDYLLLLVGQDLTSIESYDSNVPDSPGGVVGQIEIGDLRGLTIALDSGRGPNNASHLIETYSNSVLSLGVSLEGRLEELVRGELNNNLDVLIETLVQWRRPVFLRWGYGFDETQKAYNPELFVVAWMDMYRRLRQAQADNVMMVWQSSVHCGATFNGRRLDAWWPGRDFVDWIGAVYYAGDRCEMDGLDVVLELAKSVGRPVLIAESAPRRYDLSALTKSDTVNGNNARPKSPTNIWLEWYVPYFDFISRNRDIIRAVTYTNADWDSQWWWGPPYERGYWGDSRVQANSQILGRWLLETGRDRWLRASPSLFAILEGQQSLSPPVDPRPADPLPEPDPVPNPDPDPVPNPDPDPPQAQFGIDADGHLFHIDVGWSAQFHFLCVGADCLPGVRSGGFFRRNIASTVEVGETVGIEFKIENNGNQCVTGSVVVTREESGVSVPSICVP